jgi:hypothetical protein
MVTIELMAALSGAGVAAMASGAALKGWNGWLQLKKLEVEQGTRPSPPSAELKALRERIRRLEAIADGTGH